MTDVHALSGAYALDALDASETRAFEEHLLTCSDCLVEVAELRAAAATLSTLSATEPGAHVRNAVLAGIQQVRPLPPLPALTAQEPQDDPDHSAPDLALPVQNAAPTAAQAPAVPGQPETSPDPAPISSGTDPEAPGGARVVPLRRRRTRFFMAAAAAVLAAIGTGAAVVQPWDDDTRLSATEQVLNARDMTTSGTDLPGGASVEVMRSASVNAAVLLVKDMDPAPAGKVYQVWWQHDDGTMAPAGLMSGTEKDPMMLEGEADGMTGVGITVEPKGGSAQPTSSPLALVPLPRA